MRLWRLAIALMLTLFVGQMIVAQDTGSGDSAGSGEATETDGPVAKRSYKRFITNDLKKSVSKGLKRLAAMQDNAGSFTKDRRGGAQIAITSLAGMAFLANGSNLNKGPYMANVSKIVDFLLTQQDRNNGYISGKSDGSRIHGHGYATTFLAQAFGSDPTNNRIKKALEIAITCIEKGQTRWGGWGYVPDDLTWDEGSTTVCCIQALRAAADAGINVNRGTIQKAVKYMMDSAEVTPYSHEGKSYRGYTFKYSLSNHSSSKSFSLASAGVAVLNGLGVYAKGATWDEHEVGKIYKGSLGWVYAKFVSYKVTATTSTTKWGHFHYTNFYTVQAMWNAPDEAYFEYYFPKIRDLLINQQKQMRSGGWRGSNGEAYGTAFALLVLQVPYQMLPLYAK